MPIFKNQYSHPQPAVWTFFSPPSCVNFSYLTGKIIVHPASPDDEYRF